MTGHSLVTCAVWHRVALGWAIMFLLLASGTAQASDIYASSEAGRHWAQAPAAAEALLPSRAVLHDRITKSDPSPPPPQPEGAFMTASALPADQAAMPRPAVRVSSARARPCWRMLPPAQAPPG
ncbi:hypothetical protein RM533_12890 [Croceicoccus sp. F390]|uniref:Uncharacterized protein n=1 Tax=Croceicoccus esteveae TaxID=3075597 RepID=A0ABU2ZKD2_9SPHN|nr:hypothetical protein [Croceicoccus sp. F390]MDT0577063.1 hypothetical protein [Croceicoccus sp. F390]